MYAFVLDKTTGQMHADCGICGLRQTAEYREFDDGIHVMVEVTDEEQEQFWLSLHDDENSRTRIGLKLDTAEMPMKLGDRDKVQGKPIEADGIGGKEIIGYDEAPKPIKLLSTKDGKEIEYSEKRKEITITKKK